MMEVATMMDLVPPRQRHRRRAALTSRRQADQRTVRKRLFQRTCSERRGADVTGPLPLPFRPGRETLAGMKGLGFLPARSSSRPGREIEKM